MRRLRLWLPCSGWHLLLMPIALLFVLPLAQMVATSLMSNDDINRFPPRFLPDRPHLDGYRDLFTQSEVAHWVTNTVLVCSVAVVSHLVLCGLAGYGFARLRFPGRGVAFLAVLATAMIPTQLLVIPTFLMAAKVGLTNTLAAAYLPWLASAFGIFLVRQFFLSLPAELEEAAALDGCGRLRTLRSVVLPLARPVLVTLTVFTLLSSWNDLLWPLVALSDDSRLTLQAGLAQFQSARRTDWAQLEAGNVVATLPLILAFLLAQRHFVATMRAVGRH